MNESALFQVEQRLTERGSPEPPHPLENATARRPLRVCGPTQRSFSARTSQRVWASLFIRESGEEKASTFVVRTSAFFSASFFVCFLFNSAFLLRLRDLLSCCGHALKKKKMRRGASDGDGRRRAKTFSLDDGDKEEEGAKMDA